MLQAQATIEQVVTQKKDRRFSFWSSGIEAGAIVREVSRTSQESLLYQKKQMGEVKKGPRKRISLEIY